MRLYFENFARSKELDPLLNTTWYNIPQSSFTETEVTNNYLYLPGTNHSKKDWKVNIAVL